MIQYQKDIDHIVTLRLDMDGRSDNLINHEIGEAFVPVIEHLKREKARGALRGVILTSAKKSFLADGELGYLYQTRDPEELFAYAERLKRFLRDLERPGVPVVAAINGNAIGTGFEVALACHYRIVLDRPVIRLGHPEVSIGLIPSGGAILRLMWLLGIEKALPLLLEGKRYRPQEALKAGIIDQLAGTEKELLEGAKSWLLANRERSRPWDVPGSTIPGGTAKEVAVAEYLRRATARLLGTTGNSYPAQSAILEIMSEGSRLDFDTALRIDSRCFAELVRTQTCKNMISTFWFDQNAIKSGSNRPKGFGKFRPRKIGIIGAGRMGSAIALSCLQNGMRVVLKDVSKPIAERGRAYVIQKVDQLIEAGTFQESDRTELLSRIITTQQSDAFTECDLVIEAVFENEMVKKKVTREAEAHLDEYSLFGTNTISIPITRLAEASIRPDHYIGLHFFPPADEVPLVEIVRGKQTSEESVARAFDFVNAIKKIPIVVKDDWGFYAARVRNTYILEGITLLQEGYAPALIEHLGRQAGMSQGALETADELGLDIVLRYEKQAAIHYGSKYIQHPAVAVLEKMEQELKRQGKGKQGGFYDYPPQGTATLWPALTDYFPTQQTHYDRSEISERFLFAQVIEAVWCLQEGVIQSREAANLGSVFGWGFPAFKGGVIQYVFDYGLDSFLDRCETLEQRFGPRFRAPKIMKDFQPPSVKTLTKPV